MFIPTHKIITSVSGPCGYRLKLMTRAHINEILFVANTLYIAVSLFPF